MQESYISLDPAHADSMSHQVRTRVWNQRLKEAHGGIAGEMMANQVGFTTMLCSYTVMRHRGFRMTPLSPKKLPALAGLIILGVFGAMVGTRYGTLNLGNS